MKTKTPTSWLASLFAFVAASNPLPAQSVASPATETVIELSPFIVDSTRDTGYQAASTLAGTRLDTPLKDLGAAISIYTKDFLDDIGAVENADFLIYAPGMDAAGMGGNYSGAIADMNDPDVSTNQREQLQPNSRVRGLAQPSYTRNFFNSLIPLDSYNTERATVLRGPNSALVGISSPGGIVDTALAQADLKRNTNQVAFRYGNNDSMRTTADFNRVLIEDKLAVRLIGLQHREEYNQRPAYERKKRLYGAVNYQPFKSTSIRINFETGNGTANRPIPTLLMNGVPNEWLAAGRPLFDWTFYDDPARNPLAASTVVNANLTPFYAAFTIANALAIYNNPGDRRPSSIIQNSIPLTNGTAANAIRAGTFHPLLNRDLAPDNPSFVTTLNNWAWPAGAYWIGENVLPGQQPGFQPPGLKNQGFTDFSAFDWKNRMIDESSLFTHSFHSSNVTISQTAWQNRLGLELAYDQQRLDERTFASFVNGVNTTDTAVLIDLSVATPEGLPNPNVGRPVLLSRGARYNTTLTKYETRRATGYVRYDFKDLNASWGRWLGRHTLSGVVERYQADRIPAVARLSFIGPDTSVLGADTRIGIGTNPALTTYVYLGPSLAGNNNPLRLDPIKVGWIPPGPLGEISIFQRAAGTTDPGDFVKSPVSLQEFVPHARAFREVIESKAVVLQSNWLDDHVATMFSWRRDTDFNDTWSLNWADRLARGELAGPDDPGKTAFNFGDIQLPRTPQELTAAETKSYSVVLKWPRKLIRLPAGTDFRVFYNNSENFTPLGASTDQFGRRLPDPKGTTKEYGLNIAAFNNKLVLRANRYESEARNSQVGTNQLTFAVLRTLQTMAVWEREANINPQMAPSRNADIAKLKAAIGPEVLDVYQYEVFGTAPNIDARHENMPPFGRSDTLDLSAKGVEVELVYNPTSNWRILANVARQEAVKSNIAPVSKEAMAKFGSVWAELADRPRGNYPLGFQPGDTLSPNIATFGQFMDSQVGVGFAAGQAEDGIAAPELRRWRVNLVTNYNFNAGSPFFGERLKGWSIGGGVRWQSKFTLGFPSFRTADGVPGFDITNPYYAPADINVDAFVRYSRKIWGDRINWRVQLNGRNLYKERDLVPMQVQPWGQTASMRLAPERRWYLTNTFTF